MDFATLDAPLNTPTTKMERSLPRPRQTTDESHSRRRPYHSERNEAEVRLLKDENESLKLKLAKFEARHQHRSRKSSRKKPPHLSHTAQITSDSDSSLSRTFSSDSVYGPGSWMFTSHDYADDESETHDLTDEGYAFTVNRKSRSKFSLDSTLAASETTEENFENSMQASGTRGLVPEVSYNILHAHLQNSKNPLNEFNRTPTLTVVQDVRKGKSSIYRWIHFHNPAMLFEEFRHAALQTLGLDSAEHSAIARLLGHVKRSYDESEVLAFAKKKFPVMRPGYLLEPIGRSQGSKGNQSKSRLVIWACLPYFSLDQYDENPSLKDSAHPKRTLLQAHHALVDEKRDMQQAVCSISDYKPGSCFHVSQIWFLIIDNVLLLTSAHFPIADLENNAVLCNPIPMPEASRKEFQRLLVAYGDSVLWAFPLEECRTWFAFLAKFSQFWPHVGFRITYNDTQVTHDIWPLVVERAKHIGNLRLEFQLLSYLPKPLKGILRKTTGETQSEAPESVLSAIPRGNETPSGTEEKRFIPTMSKTNLNESILTNEFYVLGWLSARDKSDSKMPRGINEEVLKHDLEAAEEYLREQTDRSERVAYKQGSSSAHLAILTYLQRKARNSTALVGEDEELSDDSQSKLLEDKIDFFNAVEACFEFFLPLSTTGPMVAKFWGAVSSLLQVSNSQDPKEKNNRLRNEHHRSKKDRESQKRDLQWIGNRLAEISEMTRPCRDILSNVNVEERLKIQIPDELVTAWLHLTMALVLAAQHSSSWENQIETSISFIDKGIKILMRSLVQKSLIEYLVVMPRDIMSILTFKLLHDYTSIGTHQDILSVYSQYHRQLQREIVEKPLDRSHLDKLTRMGQEIETIKTYIQWQRTIVLAMEKSRETLSAREEVKAGHDTRPSYRVSHRDSHRVSRPEEFSKRSRYYDNYDRTERYVATGKTSHRINVYSEDVDLESGLDATAPGGYRELVEGLCSRYLNARSRNFDRISGHTSELADAIDLNISTNKDRHDNAIYAFTVVTIIFLPLSTVAGILGMNTNDIRNMKARQWVFWAVAIPLIFVVVFLCLLWTGELGNVWKGFATTTRGRGGASTRVVTSQLRSYSRSVSGPRPRSRERLHTGRSSRDQIEVYSSSSSDYGPPIRVARKGDNRAKS